jgi:hypothetical protein
LFWCFIKFDNRSLKKSQVVKCDEISLWIEERCWLYKILYELLRRRQLSNDSPDDSRKVSSYSKIRVRLHSYFAVRYQMLVRWHCLGQKEEIKTTNRLHCRRTYRKIKAILLALRVSEGKSQFSNQKRSKLLASCPCSVLRFLQQEIWCTEYFKVNRCFWWNLYFHTLVVPVTFRRKILESIWSSVSFGIFYDKEQTTENEEIAWLGMLLIRQNI